MVTVRPSQRNLRQVMTFNNLDTESVTILSSMQFGSNNHKINANQKQSHSLTCHHFMALRYSNCTLLFPLDFKAQNCIQFNVQANQKYSSEGLKIFWWNFPRGEATIVQGMIFLWDSCPRRYLYNEQFPRCEFYELKAVHIIFLPFYD